MCSRLCPVLFAVALLKGWQLRRLSGRVSPGGHSQASRFCWEIVWCAHPAGAPEVLLRLGFTRETSLRCTQGEAVGRDPNMPKYVHQEFRDTRN